MTRQLIIAGYGSRLSLRAECLRVYANQEIITEKPLRDISEVIIGKSGVSISGDALYACARHGVNVAFIDNMGKPYGLFQSPLLNRTVEVRRRQFALRDDRFAVDFCRAIVANKVANQINILRYFARSSLSKEKSLKLREAADKMRVIYRQCKQVKGEHIDSCRGVLMGLEGAAAAVYWRFIAKFLIVHSFTRREGKGATDMVNAYLNYGYGILYARLWGAMIIAGLEPFAGFLHVDRPGKYALILDMIEEFRAPAVERAVFAHFSKTSNDGGVMTDNTLSAAQRTEVAKIVVSALERCYTHKGRREHLRNIIGLQCFAVAKSIRDSAPYRPFRASL